jgi:alpha-tubulin suppressor-like RCC1 family protein
MRLACSCSALAALVVACSSVESSTPPASSAPPDVPISPVQDASAADDASRPGDAGADGTAPSGCGAGYLTCGATCCLASTAHTLALGLFFTCAIATGGVVKCWGTNNHGEGGRPIAGQSNSPVAVTGVTDAVQISASANHVCALLKGGALKCWGNNSHGQLGNGAAGGSGPFDVAGLEPVVSVAAGQRHTCAVTATGVVKCWGRNGGGNLGDGTTIDSLVPVTVVGLGAGALGVSTANLSLVDYPPDPPSSTTCALNKAGGVQCWGPASWGMSGHDGIAIGYAAGLTGGVAALSARGEEHACALTSAGQVLCWGGNGEGALGNPAAPHYVDIPPKPYAAVGVVDAVALDTGGRHACAVTRAGGVKCWGNNNNGEVGSGTTDAFVRTPIAVVGLTSGVVEIAAGVRHTCARLASGVVTCWGSSGYGELGRPGNQFVPGAVLDL